MNSEQKNECEDFEEQLRQAFQREPAPPGLKENLLAARRSRIVAMRDRRMIWWRMAAGLTLAAVLGGGITWRQHEERRKGEEAREQVLTALRITNHALDAVGQQLAAHDAREQKGEK